MIDKEVSVLKCNVHVLFMRSQRPNLYLAFGPTQDKEILQYEMSTPQKPNTSC